MQMFSFFVFCLCTSSLSLFCNGSPTTFPPRTEQQEDGTSRVADEDELKILDPAFNCEQFNCEIFYALIEPPFDIFEEFFGHLILEGLLENHVTDNDVSHLRQRQRRGTTAAAAGTTSSVKRGKGFWQYLFCGLTMGHGSICRT